MEKHEDSSAALLNKKICKSNAMIRSRYSISLLGEQCLNYSLSLISKNCTKDSKNVTISFPVSDIKLMTGCNSSRIYANLKTAAKELMTTIFVSEEPARNNFNMKILASNAVCENGVFTIYFNDKIIPDLVELKEKYTKFMLSELFSFSSVYSLRLYEFLKSFYHQKKNMVSKDQYEVSVGFPEILFIIGVYNIDDPRVEKFLDRQKPPYDYGAIAKILDPANSMDFGRFNMRILKSAITEINQCTQMAVTSIPNRSGRGGKVERITFSFSITLPEEEQKDESLINAEITQDISERIFKEMAIAGYDISIKDAEEISKQAGGDYNRFYTAFNLLRASKEEIKNPVAYILSCEKERHIASRAQLGRLKEKGIICQTNF